MLYEEAARILSLVEAKRGSVKSLTLGSKFKNKRQLMAIICETLKFSSLIQEILDATGLQNIEKDLTDTHLAKVLLYDFLIGKGLDEAGAFKDLIERHEQVLSDEVERIKTSKKISCITELLESSPINSAYIPRYVRVNSLKGNIEKIIDSFVREDYELISTGNCSFNDYVNTVQHLASNQFTIDITVPGLLVFPPGTEFHEHDLYQNGTIILQDKASCMPAVILNPPPGSHVIDCCAAPGNKTSLLAALMGNEGEIFAFDMDAKRVATMNSLLEKAGARCVRTMCADFLRVNPRDPKYAKVDYILVDPSCSGSGIVNRFSTSDEESYSKKRLESLASFQAMILRHAMSFPSARHVVYSTCSVHDRENELVVSDVLSRCSGTFQLVDIASNLGPTCRGKSDIFPGAEKCIRMTPETSLTNGFFIARFERVRSVGPTDSLQITDYKSLHAFENSLSVKRKSVALVGNNAEYTREKKDASKKRRKKQVSKVEKPAPTILSDRLKKKKQKRSKKHTGNRAVTA